jgi:hypothetical protein
VHLPFRLYTNLLGTILKTGLVENCAIKAKQSKAKEKEKNS